MLNPIDDISKPVKRAVYTNNADSLTSFIKELHDYQLQEKNRSTAETFRAYGGLLLKILGISMSCENRFFIILKCILLHMPC